MGEMICFLGFESCVLLVLRLLEVWRGEVGLCGPDLIFGLDGTFLGVKRGVFLCSLTFENYCSVIWRYVMYGSY